MNGENKMKTKMIFLVITVFVVSLSTYNLSGQTGYSGEQDTTQNMTQDEMNKQNADDQERIDNARDAKKETKAASKKTQQINRDAMDASRETSKAYREEKKAQKARNNATKQAKKAEDARRKSDSN